MKFKTKVSVTLITLFLAIGMMSSEVMAKSKRNTNKKTDNGECGHLYVGKAVSFKLCNALVGCSNFDGKVLGHSNYLASVEVTESGQLYGNTYELACSEVH